MKPLKSLTHYGLLAQRHWRQFLPQRVAELEAKGLLEEALLEAEEMTDAQLDRLRRQFIRQGLSPQQAHDRAWEMVRSEFVLLPPEQ